MDVRMLGPFEVRLAGRRLVLGGVKQRAVLVVPGAVFTVVLWGLVSLGFRWYVANLGQFSVTYGSVGAIIVLLTYFYLSSLILLTGAELNAAIQRARPQEGDACVKELPAEEQEDSHRDAEENGKNE